jgi:putative nucleotidyltransferase with HDIG domain
MAELPVPRPQLTDEPAAAAVAEAAPDGAHEVLAGLWGAGHAAYLVGGSLRDALLGRLATDWDLATDALPERVQALFPGAVYENRFGTVGIRRDGRTYDVTTFRTDHDYADFRRPHRIEFGESIELDLARRDFTANAIAWGAERVRAGGSPEPRLVDPFGGRPDLLARRLRAVGDPVKRFEEDALRMVRAVRLAAQLEFEIEAATLAAIRSRAELVRHLSGERIASELDKLLAAPRPSIGLRLMADTGLLGWISPELAAQRGLLQNKIPGDDLWDHTLRSVDAAPADRPIVRLAALLHDIGKPATAADGHFRGHDVAGAELAVALLGRLRVARETTRRVADLIRHHMFEYEPSWSDAAIRRFILKIGWNELVELFQLRAADNVGSGIPADAGLAELRRRVEEQREAEVALGRSDLAIDGHDLIAELGLQEGPRLGRILDELLERVIVDPGLNDRPTLLMLAQSMLERDA